MRRLTTLISGLVLTALLILAGCAKQEEHDAHDHDAHDHAHDDDHHGHDHEAHADEDGDAPARFVEGRGLLLADRTAEALGLATSRAELQFVTPSYEVSASVFEAGAPARASSFVPVELADALETPSVEGAKLIHIRRELVGALKQAELVFEIPGKATVGSTLTLQLTTPRREGLSVPRSALLHTATGTYLYVVNKDHLLRTPVKTGAGDQDRVEILDGLHPGAVVVIAAVEQLWLTELRLTKGGGHSH